MDVMKKIFRYAALLVLLFCMGCSDWLDVRPKSQVKEDDLFTSESGFRDALIGIYALMGRTDTYGGNWDSWTYCHRPIHRSCTIIIKR